MTTSAGAVLRSLWRRADVGFRNEVLVIVASLVAIQFFPGGVHGSDYVGGIVTGAPIAMGAVAVVLVFRINRFINFAQLQAAAWAGALFAGLAQGEGMLRGLHSVCGCVSVVPGPTAFAINFGVSAVLAIIAAMLVGAAVSIVLIPRLSRGGQLILTLASVYLAQLLAGSQTSLVGKLVPTSLETRGLIPSQLSPPVSKSITIAGLPIPFAGWLTVIVAILVVAGISLYLRTSDTGIAIRAAAQNGPRAATLGVGAGAVNLRVWLLSGLVTGLVGVLGAFSGLPTQQSGSFSLDVNGFVLILVAASAARFLSLWMAAVTALVVGIAQAAVQTAFSSTAPLEAALVIVIGALMLLQRRDFSRAGAEDFSGSNLITELRPIPAQLRDVDTVRRSQIIGIVVLAVLVLGIPFALNSGQVSLLSDYTAFILVGLGIVILSGWAGQAALGQFGFATVGAWAAAVTGLPLLPAVLVGGITGAVVAVLVGVPGLKLRGLSLAVTSLAFATSAYAIFIDPQYLGRFLPAAVKTPEVFGLDLSGSVTYYYVCLAVTVIACIAVVGIRRSRTGRVLIALRDNEAAAQSFGVNPLRARLTGYAVAGFLSALAGGLIVFRLGAVAPSEFSPDQSITTFVLTAIGGLGGLSGPILGFAFGWALSLSSNQFLQYFGSGIGALFLLYFVPGGLAQGVNNGRDALLRRIAIRRRINVPSLLGADAFTVAAERLALNESRQLPREVTHRYALPDQWSLDHYSEPEASNRG